MLYRKNLIAPRNGWESALPPIGHHARVTHVVMLCLASCGIRDQFLLGQFKKLCTDSNWFTFERIAAMSVTELVEMLKPFSKWEQNCVRLKLFAEHVLQHGFPTTLQELCVRHGIQNKVACLILWAAFGIVAGIPVDRHVKRYAIGAGWTNTTDDNEIAHQLQSWIPRTQWLSVNDNIAGLAQLLKTNPNEVLAAASELGEGFVAIVDLVNTKESAK